jgi:hypothetical protein
MEQISESDEESYIIQAHKNYKITKLLKPNKIL